jgi:hypothetical protein
MLVALATMASSSSSEGWARDEIKRSLETTRKGWLAELVKILMVGGGCVDYRDNRNLRNSSEVSESMHNRRECVQFRG